MVSVSIRLEGFESTLAALRRQPELAKSLLVKVVRDSSFRVADGARKRVPVRTGDLLQAIEADSTGLKGRVSIRSDRDKITGQDPQVYWYFVEFGTFRSPAKPFIRPAAEDEEPRFIDDARAIGPRLERDFGR